MSSSIHIHFFLIFIFVFNSYFENLTQNRDRVCVAMCLYVSLASDSSVTITVTIVKLGTMTASDMRLHHVLIMLTLTFIQGHTHINQENNKCSIISENVQATPIRVAVKIVRLKFYINFSQSDDPAPHPRPQLRLKLCKCLTHTTKLVL